MGAVGSVLREPLQLVRVQRNGGKSFRFAAAEMQGWRSHFEDAHSMSCTGCFGSFWVLDGHGGDASARLAARMFVEEFMRHGRAACSGDLVSNDEIENKFIAIDERLRERALANTDIGDDSGATVIGMVVVECKDATYSLKLANCGDARGVVCRGPDEQESCQTPVELKGIAALRCKECPWPVIAQTMDHKPDDPEETARVEAAGGWVSRAKPPRIDDILAVSRGVGDFHLKNVPSLSASAQKVSCVPEVYEVAGIRPGAFCILACDGLWDVMSSHDAAAYVRDRLQNEPGVDIGDIASALVRMSLELKSRDNVSVMIVHFQNGMDWSATSDTFNCSDEIQHFEQLADMDHNEVIKDQCNAWLERCEFPGKPVQCCVTGRWHKEMIECGLTNSVYGTKALHKRALENGGHMQAQDPAPNTKRKGRNVASNTGQVLVTVVHVSGEHAYGPEELHSSTTVGALKELFQAGTAKEMFFHGRLLDNRDTLGTVCNGGFSLKILVGTASDDQLRSLAASTALADISLDDFLEIVTISVESFVYLVRVIYTVCLLALDAVQGEARSRFWNDMGGCPLLRSTELLTVCLNEDLPPPGSITIRAFSSRHWPNGSMFPAGCILDSLKSFDHHKFRAGLQNDIHRKEEIRVLLASPGLTIINVNALGDRIKKQEPHGATAHRCILALTGWLLASVAPLVCGLSPGESSLILRSALGFGRRGKSKRDETLLQLTFEQWDSNGDGKISESELEDVITRLDPRFTTDDVSTIFAATDLNHDHFIDYQEFIKWLFT